MKALLSSLSLISLLAWQAPAVAAPSSDCQGEQINKTFASGAMWDFCWTIKDQEGLVLSQVHYQAPGTAYRRVFGEGALSPI